MDDSVSDLEIIKGVLKKWEIIYTLYIAHNGIEALNMLTRDEDRVSPDLILLDISLPKMNGLEFLGIVKSYYSLRNIKIFLITSSAEAYEKISTHNLGVSGYIIKPFNFSGKLSSDVLNLKRTLRNGN